MGRESLGIESQQPARSPFGPIYLPGAISVPAAAAAAAATRKRPAENNANQSINLIASWSKSELAGFWATSLCTRRLLSIVLAARPACEMGSAILGGSLIAIGQVPAEAENQQCDCPWPEIGRLDGIFLFVGLLFRLTIETLAV